MECREQCSEATLQSLHTCGVRSAKVGCEGGEGEGGGQTGGGAEGGAEREVEAVADHCKEQHGRRSGCGKVVHTTGYLA